MLRICRKTLGGFLVGLAIVAAGQESALIPVNAQMFRFRRPDGTELFFLRDREEPNLLHGERPWTAELDGRRALVMANADDEEQREGFMFFDGYLRMRLQGNRETKVPLPPPQDEPNGLAALWPPPEKRLVAIDPPDVWRGGSRLRLWFDNPNKAGLLFAELALAALALLFVRPVWCRILGAALSLAAFGGLVLTSSRGGLVAFLCGLAAMAATRAKSLFTARRLMLIALAAAVAVGGLFAAGQGERMAKNLFKEGQRETSRLTVWKEVPRMMADAPGGWGYGRSARAYIDWYQPRSECLLKDLISGHLTFLVESGWTMRFVYVFLWLAVGIAALWEAFRGVSPVPAALVSAFAAAACFNPVIAVPELWAIPIAAVLWLGIVRFREIASRRTLVSAGLAAGLAGVMLGTVYAWGSLSPAKVSVRKSGNAVCLNGTKPTVWLVDDDYALHGGFWWHAGHDLREVISKKDPPVAIGYVRSVSDLPSEVEKLVLVGEAGRDFLACEKRPLAKQVVFLSPPFPWSSVPKELRAVGKVKMVVGEHAARRAMGGETTPPWGVLVRGAEIYLPNWAEFVL